MKVRLSIDPRQGLGDLKFGSTPDQVRSYLGKPTKVDRRKDPADDDFAWYYKKLGLDVLFQTGELRQGAWKFGGRPRVTLFTYSAKPTLSDMARYFTGVKKGILFTGRTKLTLWGAGMIGLSESELLALFASKGHTSPSLESPDGYPDSLKAGVRILRFGELGIDLHFQGGTLDGVQWGVPWQESPFMPCFP